MLGPSGVKPGNGPLINLTEAMLMVCGVDGMQVLLDCDESC
jgi:hypothetical protein